MCMDSSLGGQALRGREPPQHLLHHVGLHFAVQQASSVFLWPAPAVVERKVLPSCRRIGSTRVAPGARRRCGIRTRSSGGIAHATAAGKRKNGPATRFTRGQHHGLCIPRREVTRVRAGAQVRLSSAPSGCCPEMSIHSDSERQVGRAAQLEAAAAQGQQGATTNPCTSMRRDRRKAARMPDSSDDHVDQPAGHHHDLLRRAAFEELLRRFAARQRRARSPRARRWRQPEMEPRSLPLTCSISSTTSDLSAAFVHLWPRGRRECRRPPWRTPGPATADG